MALDILCLDMSGRAELSLPVLGWNNSGFRLVSIETSSKDFGQFVFFSVCPVDVYSSVVLRLEVLAAVQTSILSSLDVSGLNMVDNCFKAHSGLFADGAVRTIRF